MQESKLTEYVEASLVILRQCHGN